jgi:hypothetical protein
MGNLINLFAEGAARRAEKTSWIAVNIGYARSELDGLEDERYPGIPARLFDQLEALLAEVITTEAGLAKLVRTFERKGNIEIIGELQQITARISELIHTRVHEYNAHSWQRAANAFYARMDGDSWDEDDEVGTLLSMIGGEVIPMLEFLRASFEGLAGEIQKTAEARHEAPEQP